MIETERLLLRPWRETDRAPFAAMMADPEVGNWLGRTRTAEESAAWIEAEAADFARTSLGFLAIERRSDGAFLGAAGLLDVEPGMPGAPGVEIGWRLVRDAWGRGYATEAARALLADGFGRLSLTAIVAFTADSNVRSRAVMERIGMERRADLDFLHPRLAADHPLRAHVVYVARP